MLQKTLKFRSMLVLVLGLSLLCSGAFAQGDRNRTDRGESSRGDVRGNMRADVQTDVRRDGQNNDKGPFTGIITRTNGITTVMAGGITGAGSGGNSPFPRSR
jgi:hypothetical protein